MALADYIDNKPTIDTLRLRIRPMCKADVPALMEWMPDKTIYKYWGKGPGQDGQLVVRLLLLWHAFW